jgi:hypothetical protein
MLNVALQSSHSIFIVSRLADRAASLASLRPNRDSRANTGHWTAKQVRLVTPSFASGSRRGP